MKKLLLLLLLVTTISQNGNAQTWTYYKDFPANVIPKDIDINDAGTLFMLTENDKVFYKTINGLWTEIPLPQQTGISVPTPLCISVQKTSNTLFYGSNSNGLFFTPNFGANWSNLTFLDISTGQFSVNETISVLSNKRNSGPVYGAGVVYENGLPISFITRNSTTAGSLFVFDESGNSDTIPSSLFFTLNNRLLVGTENNGIWISLNNGNTFEQSNFALDKIQSFTENGTGRVYALGKRVTTNENFLIYSDDYLNWTPLTLPNLNEEYTSIHFDTTSQNLWLGSRSGIYKMTTSSSPLNWTSALLNNSEHSIVEIIGNSTSIYNFSNQKIAQKLNPSETAWNMENNGLMGSIDKCLFNENNVLFASSFESNSISSSINASSDWQNVDVGITSINNGVTNFFLKQNGKVFVSTYGKIKKSLDNGITYTDITPPNTSSISKFYAGGSRLFCVKGDNQNQLYWSPDEGTTWLLLNTFSSGTFNTNIISSISEDSNGIVYVTQNTLEQSSGTFRVHYTVNGINWSSKVLNNANINGSMSLYSKNNKTLVNIGGKIYSFNYSSTTNAFTPLTYPSGVTVFNNLTIDNLGNYYAFNNNLYKSSNEGTSWINLGKPNELDTSSNPNIKEVFFDNANDAYIIASETIQTNDKGIYKVTQALGLNNSTLENTIAAYPNPAKNTVSIKTVEELNEIVVFDVSGKKVTTSRIGDNAIDISTIETGLYFIKAVTKKGEKLVSKFIKN